MIYLPQNYIIRTGIGRSTHKLGAFDRALICAGVGGYNLIKVSSILPPGCEPRNDITLAEGALLPSAFVAIYSNSIGKTISSAVAIGIPVDKTCVGVIMKCTAYNNKEITEKSVRQFAEMAMDDRDIAIDKIVSDSAEIKITTDEIYCAFATVSMW